jgi:hypothetical protein
VYEPRPRGKFIGERADGRRVSEAEHFFDARRATVGSICAIWHGLRTTKARCRTRRKMEFSSHTRRPARDPRGQKVKTK